MFSEHGLEGSVIELGEAVSRLIGCAISLGEEVLSRVENEAFLDNADETGREFLGPWA